MRKTKSEVIILNNSVIAENYKHANRIYQDCADKVPRQYTYL